MKAKYEGFEVWESFFVGPFLAVGFSWGVDVQASGSLAEKELDVDPHLRGALPL